MASVRDMRSLLHSLVDGTEGEHVSVEDLLNAVGRRAYGPLLLLLGFIAISPLTVVPGANWLIALITLLIAGQIVVGLKRPWVPQRLLKIEFPRSALEAGVRSMQQPAYIMDRLVRPRFAFLTAAPFIQLIALICVGAALITFPLGLVLFGPVLPSLAIMLMGLGLTARDGVMVMLAGGALAGALLILLRLFL